MRIDESSHRFNGVNPMLICACCQRVGTEYNEVIDEVCDECHVEIDEQEMSSEWDNAEAEWDDQDAEDWSDDDSGWQDDGQWDN